MIGLDPPVRVEAYDGSATGPRSAETTIAVRSPDALRRILGAPGELGFARAYIAGDIDVDGSIFDVLDLRDRVASPSLGLREAAAVVRLLGQNLKPPPPPETEFVPRGRRHGRARDRSVISYHYDVANEFYMSFLGSTLTYSCAVFENDGQGLEDAQRNKYELICRKLDLRPGMRLLDIGCGWGGMVLHAALHHGVSAVGATVSSEQASLARRRIRAAGLDRQVEIRLQDYRDVADGPFDAISSIGMFEHVGLARIKTYVGRLHSQLREGGRFLNHAISRPRHQRARLPRRSFVNRYVFPDGELHEVGTVVTAMAEAGFETRHVESLREHYARTLRHWVTNLESNWDDAVAAAGPMRARAWRLYMAGSALNFEANRTGIHQVLVTATGTTGVAGMPWRPGWDREPLQPQIDLRETHPRERSVSN
ncbi:MAG: class I SAM-dependent methyltransferase [Acidimicrobiales bacterium]